MSPSIKLALFTLASSAAAIPHYGGHSRFHSSKAAGTGGYGAPHGTGSLKPYPSGGWGGHRHHNQTAHGATGTGYQPTTTLLETVYSTETEVSTIHASKPQSGAGYEASSSVGAAAVSSGAAGGCGPATVYVTATNKVTVTVPAGGAASSAPAYSAPAVSAPESQALPVSSPAASSAAAVSSAPAGGYGAPSVSFALPSSVLSVGEERVSKPAYSAPAVSSAPIVVSSAAPVSSAAAVSSAAPVSSAAASSSAAKPSSSSSPSYTGGKRGLAYNDASLCSKFNDGKFSFAYNWAQSEAASLPNGVQFIPMMHKPSDSTAEKWLQNVDAAVKKGSKAVMGFNEADLASQANLSPEQACADWKSYMQPIASSHSDVTILGPSVTNGQAPLGLDWLSRFQKACPDMTWHAANIHFYDQYDDKVVDRFIQHVKDAASQTNKKIWVTEFGLNPGTASTAQAATFLQKCMEFMDSSDLVEGYSYFMVGTGENQLITGSTLNNIGNIYAGSS